MRAWYSTGRQRVTGENPSAVGQSRVRGDPSADQTAWVYSRLWVLVLAAILGPASIIFALVYRKHDTRARAPDQ